MDELLRAARVLVVDDQPANVALLTRTRAGQVDCNNDDYFHPNPKAASYLATKWNVANSRFLSSGSAPAPPAETSVTVPSGRLAGVPWNVRADVATIGAGIAWSSTLDGCRLANSNPAATTWSCPATMAGTEGQVTVHVTENGVTAPYSYPVTFVVPTPPRGARLALTASSSKIRSGQKVTVTGTMTDAQNGQPVYGMPVELRAQQGGSSTWTTIATVTTGLGGRVSASVAPK